MAKIDLSTFKVAVITPVFKHSNLVTEAIESVLTQSSNCDVIHIIVNDGCPFRQTHDTATAYSTVYPNRIVYLNKPNGGLSSARNFGVRYVLQNLADIDAFYFLDADNRLEKGAIERASSYMRESRVDWVYPDVDMFGLEAGWDYGGEFSNFLMHHINICEAGSLINRRIFDAGVFFDEKMKQGYEDWDFFISAIRAGFVGKHLDNFGLRYRKRPESMLADSTSIDAELKQKMRMKHTEYFDHKSMMSAEHREFPRYAIFIVDEGRWIYTGDPSNIHGFPDRDAKTDFWAALLEPGRMAFPPFVAFASRKTLNLLDQLRQANWSFWAMEEILVSTPVSTVSFTNELGDPLSVQTGPGRSARNASAIMMTFDTLRAIILDSSMAWIEGVARPSDNMIGEVQINYNQPHLDHVANVPVMFDLFAQISAFRSSAYREAANTEWSWRKSPFRRVDAFYINRRKFSNVPSFPLDTSKSRNVGFVLPLVEFGGVEKVALRLAEVMKQAGWRTHLYVTERNTAYVTAEWLQAFDNIIFLNDDSQNSWSGPNKYMGTKIANWESDHRRNRALSLMGWQDVVINCHGASANWLMGSLRRLGAITVASLHLNDMTSYKRPLGHPMLALAFEHAYDYIATCSHQLADWCIGIGFPQEKVVAVPNAPTYLVTNAMIDDVFEKRLQRSNAGSNLKGLFIGRLDPQKGLGRLSTIVSLSQHKQTKVDWTIVGKAVQSSNVPDDLASLIPFVQSPVYSREEILSLYGDADVVVLVSEYEGLPLVVLEAMRMGVVVVATNVGAVSEVIVDGVNGFLVDNTGDVEGCVLDILDTLHADRDRLQAISRQAVTSVKDRTWQNAASDLLSAIDRQIQRVAAMKDK